MQAEIRTGETLQKLDRWLVGNGVPVRRAIFTTESIRAFSHRIRQEFKEDTQIGVLAGLPLIGRTHVLLSLLWPRSLSLDSYEDSKKMNHITEIFDRSVAIPLMSNPRVNLEYVPPQILNRPFLEALQLLSDESDCQFVGLVDVKR